MQRVDGAAIAEAARECNVLYWRLRARVAGRPRRSTRPTNKQRLACDQEEALQIYMRRWDRIGLCARLPFVHNAVNSILALRRSSHPGAFSRSRLVHRSPALLQQPCLVLFPGRCFRAAPFLSPYIPTQQLHTQSSVSIGTKTLEKPQSELVQGQTETPRSRPGRRIGRNGR